MEDDQLELETFVPTHSMSTGAGKEELEAVVDLVPGMEEEGQQEGKEDWVYCFVFENVKRPESVLDNDAADEEEEEPSALRKCLPCARNVKAVNYEKRKAKLDQKLRAKAEILHELKRVGLATREDVSLDQTEVYVVVGAPDELLRQVAEKMALPVKLRPQYGGGYASYTISRHELFEPHRVYRPNPQFFTSLQKIQIMEFLIEMPKESGGCGINLGREVTARAMQSYFPLHEPTTKQWLLDWWAKKWFLPQRRSVYELQEDQVDEEVLPPTAPPRPEDGELPRYRIIDVVADYFGEEIGLYFAWLGLYTAWLIGAAIFGVLALIITLAVPAFEQHLDTWPAAIYALFLALWASAFLEFWKRKNASLNYDWNTWNFEAKERERPEFVGGSRPGVWHMGEWVELDTRDIEAFPGMELPHSRYQEKTWHSLKITAAFVPMVVFIAVVAIAAIALLTLRLVLQNSFTASGVPRGATIGGGLGSIINAVVILILNFVYKKIAVVLNDWENHRTDTEYYDKLTVKVFLFQFVNSYISLYYLAFVKGGAYGAGVDLWGAVHDECVEVTNSVFGCMPEVTTQLLIILIVNTVVLQLQEFLIPPIMALVKRKFIQRKAQKLGMSLEEMRLRETQWELEENYGPYAGIFDEYSELVIQFGYITLFASALTVAPALALLNNFIEIRTDASKMLLGVRRPEYRGAQDIGLWYQILQFLTILAIMTNALMIPFGSSAIVSISSSLRTDPLLLLAVAVILEHVLFAVKAVIAWFIPDVPEHIRRQIAKEEYIKELTIHHKLLEADKRATAAPM